jgi:hypothetical protein
MSRPCYFRCWSPLTALGCCAWTLLSWAQDLVLSFGNGYVNVYLHVYMWCCAFQLSVLMLLSFNGFL